MQVRTASNARRCSKHGLASYDLSHMGLSSSSTLLQPLHHELMNVSRRPSKPARMSFFSRLSLRFASLAFARAVRLSVRLRHSMAQ